MGTWKNCVLSAGKRRGGSADFIFMGARIFLKDSEAWEPPQFSEKKRSLGVNKIEKRLMGGETYCAIFWGGNVQ